MLIIIEIRFIIFILLFLRVFIFYDEKDFFHGFPKKTGNFKCQQCRRHKLACLDRMYGEPRYAYFIGQLLLGHFVPFKPALSNVVTQFHIDYPPNTVIAFLGNDRIFLFT